MRAKDEMYTVGGQALLVPDAGVELSYADLDSADSGRDEAGVMHRFVVREKVRTWGFSYAFLTAAEWTYLQGLFAGRATFPFTFPDGGGKASCTAYCSNYSAALLDRKRGLYKGLKFNIIEC